MTKIWKMGVRISKRGNGQASVLPTFPLLLLDAHTSGRFRGSISSLESGAAHFCISVGESNNRKLVLMVGVSLEDQVPAACTQRLSRPKRCRGASGGIH